MAWVSSETNPFDLPEFVAIVDPNPPKFLFRVVVNYRSPNREWDSFHNFRLSPLEPHRPPTPELFDAHLSQTHEQTPFTLFTCSWAQALRDRDATLRQNSADVAVMALKVSPELELFDAHEIAKRLGYVDGGADPARQLGVFRDRFLLHGLSRPDSVVAMFRGHEPPMVLRFAWLGIEREIWVPGRYADPRRRIAQVLAWEMEQNVGHCDQSDLIALVKAMTT